MGNLSLLANRKALIGLATHTFFQGTAFSLTFFLMYAYAVETLGFSPTDVAVSISLSSFAYALTQPIWGRLLDAVPRRRVFILTGYFLSGLFILWTYTARGSLEYYAATALGRVASGLAEAAWLVMLGEITSLEERGRVSGIVTTSSTIGTGLLSPIMGLVMDLYGYAFAGWLGLLLNLAAGITIFSVPKAVVRAQVIRESDKPRNGSTESGFRPFLIASIIWTFIWSLAWPLFPVAQIRIFRMSKTEIGLISTVANLTRLFLQPAWGYVADKIGRKYLLVMSPALASVIPFSYYLGTGLIHVLAGTAIGMVGFSMYFVASPTYLLDTSSPGRRGRTVTTFNAFTSLTSSVAPMVGGTLGDLIGVRETLLLLGFSRLISSALFVKIPETLRK